MIEIIPVPEHKGKFIGKGTDRSVTRHGRWYVLKEAVTPRGIKQNKLECEISEDPKSDGLVAKVVARTEDFKYVVMRYARKSNTYWPLYKSFDCGSPKPYELYKNFGLHEAEFGYKGRNKNDKNFVAIDYGFGLNICGI